MAEQQKPVEPATATDRNAPAAGPAAPWPVPTLLRRFAALMIDWLLCLLAAGLLGRFPHNNWAPFVLVVEYAFFIGLFRQTPGMRLTRIACVSVTDGGPIGIPRAFLRGLLLALLVPALIMDRQRRGWHDKAAGSIVIETRPSTT